MAPSLCQVHVRRKSRKFVMFYFKQKGCHRAGNMGKDILSIVPSPGDDKNSAGIKPQFGH